MVLKNNVNVFFLYMKVRPNTELSDLDNNSDDVEWFELDTNSGNVSLHSQPNPGTIGVAEDTAAAEPCPLKPLTGNQVLKAQFSH